MVVNVEIGGILERRLRRLVELGVYASVAEAVREAVRVMLDSMDLRKYALELYISREASLHYVAEFAGETFQGMIDYMMSRGVTPAVGAASREDYKPLEPREVILDAFTLYVVYKTRLGDVLSRLRGEGIHVLVPKSVESYLHILAAERIRRGLALPGEPERVEVEEREDPSVPLTPLELGVIEYARREGVPLLSDDFRTRGFARRRGVRAYSSLSLLSTLLRVDGAAESLVPDVVLSVRAIPLIVPLEAYEEWGLRV